MTPRPTPEALAAARSLLAAVAARIVGATIDADEPDYLMIGDACAACSLGSGNIAATFVFGWDGRDIVTAMPSAIVTPNGHPSQVWEVVALIAERMTERERRAPEMARLAAESAARSGPTREPGDKVYSDGSEVSS